MCLIVDKRATKKMKEYFQTHKKRMFFKGMKVDISKKELHSMIYDKGKVKGGWYKSNRKTKRIVRNCVKSGIHVYHNKKEPIMISEIETFIKVYGYRNDYIASENYPKTSVFLKIWIPAQEIKRAISRIEKCQNQDKKYIQR